MKEVILVFAFVFNMLLWFFLPEAALWFGRECPVTLKFSAYSRSKSIKIALLMTALFVATIAGMKTASPLDFAEIGIACLIWSAMFGLFGRATWNELRRER
jgi:hypothetical protein